MDVSNNPKRFRDLYLSDDLIQALDAVRYTTPTPVQAATIPLILAGIDLIVQSQTGTGKTAAFAIPVLEMLDPAPGKVEVLVLTPTRELAKQVCDEFERLSKFKRLQTAAIYGGASYGPQIAALAHAQVVCATPGRLLDLLKQDKISLKHLRFFILDEADEMLSMGFERDLHAILDYLPEERQNLLFSATVTDDIRSLASRILFYPEFISLSSDSVANVDVNHVFYPVTGIGRMRDLVRVLEYESPETAIIFANTKSDTFLVSSFLQRHNYKVDVLNGDLPQNEREKTLAALRRGELRLLVATDVAARGIDISDLSHVINYTLPEDAAVYVHRTGRTGRAGKKGHAISLISPREMAIYLHIQKHFGIRFTQRPLPSTRDIVAQKQAQALLQWQERVDRVEGLQYGQLMGLARRLMQADKEEQATDYARLLAKLLALADKTLTHQHLPVEAPISFTTSPVGAAPPIATTEAALEEPPPAAPQDEPRSEGRNARRDRNDRGRSNLQEHAEAPSQPVPVAQFGAYGAPPKPLIPEDLDPEEAAAVAELGPLDELVAPLSLVGLDDEDDTPPTPQNAGERLGYDSVRRGRRGRGARDRDHRSRDRRERREERAAAPAPIPPPKPIVHEMSKLYVTVGKGAFATAEALRSWLANMTGMDTTDFGAVELDRNTSIVEVRQDLFYDVISALNGQEWEGKLLTVRPWRPK
jgi:ATP-dependent RNA helicase DeaD